MAFVQPQLYPVQFVGGVDTKTDPFQIVAGNLLTLENGIFNNIGALNKRSGFDTLSNAISGGSSFIASAQALATFEDELLLFDGTYMYSYIEETEEWAEKGVAISVITSSSVIVKDISSQQLNPDYNISHNIEVYAWEDSRGGVWYLVKDYSTGNIVVNATQIGSSSSYVKPKIIVFNNLFYIFYSDGNQTLYYNIINPFNPSILSSQNTFITTGYAGLTSGFGFDFIVNKTTNTLYFAALQTISGTPGIYIQSYNTALILQNQTNILNGISGQYSVVAINLDSDQNVWVAWGDSVEAWVSAMNSNLQLYFELTFLGSSTPYNITIIESTTPTVMTIAIENYNSISPTYQTINIVSCNLSGSPTFIGTIYGVGLASKAFNVNGNICINTAFQSPLQSTYFTIRLNSTPFQVIDKISPATGGGLRTNFTISQCPTIATDTVKFANSIKGQLISEAGTLFTLLGVNASTLDFASPNIFLNISEAESLLFVGGISQIYDGTTNIVEQNFHYYPEIPANWVGTSLQSSYVVPGIESGGEMTAGGQYQYAFTYEWGDNQGNIHQSTPSPAYTTILSSSDNAVSITVPTLKLTMKQPPNDTNVSICIYRTQANLTIFYEVTNFALSPTLNNVTTNTITFVDTESDTSISSNRPLYTTGGVLPNTSPPANSLVCLFQNRVMLSGMEDQNLIWYSQNINNYTNYNTTPVNFCSSNIIGCDPLGGPITAIKALNQNLIIFKETNIFYLQGDGPDNTGNGTSYPNPQLLASDVGCNNPNSVVLTPLGLLFQSNKGIYQLDPSLDAPIYIGAKVEVYNDLTISSATLVPNSNQVYFTTETGTTLVYDYFVNQWSTFTNQYASDSVIFDNLFCFINPYTGIVWQNTPTSFSDNGNPISLSWTSPNFSFAQINGYQRVFRLFLLGTFKGTHTLQVSVSYDGNPSYTQFATIEPDNTINISLWGSDGYWGQSSPWGGAYTPYQFRIDFSQQVCSSIRINVQDLQSSDYNEGYSISAMAFEVGILPNGYKIPATQTYGAQ